MELEALNKSQIVLLTLLVSFVTSIATGIVTVSLMEQAPKDVTRVIQRTVVRTVEKVSPPEVHTKVVTREKQIIVPEEDVIASAVAQAEPSVVKIYTAEEDAAFLARGVAITQSGIIATDASTLTEADVYRVVAGEDTYEADVLRRGGERQIALLQIKDSENVPAPASIVDDSIKLGTRVVALTGTDNMSLQQGIVSQLSAGMFAVSFDVPPKTPGTILINNNGAVMGISTAASRSLGDNWYITARSILATLQTPLQQKETSSHATTTASSTQTAAAAAALNASSTTP